MMKVGARRAMAGGMAIAFGVTLGGALSDASADRYGRRNDGRYVVAESQWGNGSISGPVRPGPRGVWQVRLPHGTWIDCVRGCSDTLRRATIDFWQSHGKNAPGSAPGYLHWEFNF